MKKGVLIGSIIINIVMILGLNIYIYISNSKISENVNQNNVNVKSIILIDRFRTDINVMTQLQKLYLVTGKIEYKEKCEQKLDSVYQTINEMEYSGYIKSQEREELINAIEKYADGNMLTMNMEHPDPISEKMETEIIKSNADQLNLLKKLDKVVEENSTSVDVNNKNITSKNESQQNGVQFISAVITGILSTGLYSIKKNPQKFGEQIGSIIKCIDKEEHDKDINEAKDIKLTEDDINNIREDIVYYEKVLETIKLVYKQSGKIQEKLDKSEELINKIDESLNKLRIKIEEAENSTTGITSIMIRDIEEQFIELRILFETLPDYNEFIIEISKEVIDYINKEK